MTFKNLETRIQIIVGSECLLCVLLLFWQNKLIFKQHQVKFLFIVDMYLYL